MPTIEGAGARALLNAGAPVNGTSEQQTVTLANASGGSFRLTFDGHTTAPIAYNAEASAVQTALRALASIGSDGCTVSGSAGGPYTVIFAGVLAKKNLPQLTALITELEGEGAAVTVETSVAGVDATYRGAAPGTLLYDTTNGRLYINRGTGANVDWAEIVNLDAFNGVTIDLTKCTAEIVRPLLDPLANDADAAAIVARINAIIGVITDTFALTS